VVEEAHAELEIGSVAIRAVGEEGEMDAPGGALEEGALHRSARRRRLGALRLAHDRGDEGGILLARAVEDLPGKEMLAGLRLRDEEPGMRGREDDARR